MRRMPGLAVLLAVGLFATDVLAARLIVVLPLDVHLTKGKLDDAAQGALEETLRDVATNALAPAGWTVLSGENTIAVLRDNGVTPERCGEQSCHLAMARELKAEKFLSGAVEFVDGHFTASIRLIDTRTGSILASERLSGATATALSDAIEAKAPDLFARARLIGSSSPAEAAPVAPVEQEKAAPPPTAADLILNAQDDLGAARRRRIAGWTMFGLGNGFGLITMGMGFSGINASGYPGFLSYVMLTTSGALAGSAGAYGRSGISLLGGSNGFSGKWIAGWTLYGLGLLGSTIVASFDIIGAASGSEDAWGVAIGGMEFVPLIFLGLATILLEMDASEHGDQLAADITKAGGTLSSLDVRLDVVAVRGNIGPALTFYW